MNIPQLILTYVVALLGALCVVGAYAEFRRRSFNPGSTEDSIFRCGKCGYVYTDEPDLDRSRCSQCGQINEPIKF
jgi:rubrerythrin